MKTTKRYNVSVRLAKIRKLDSAKCSQGCGDMGSLLYGWSGHRLKTWKRLWHHLVLLSIHRPPDPAILL